jgi:hypothetical protein
MAGAACIGVHCLLIRTFLDNDDTNASKTMLMCCLTLYCMWNSIALQSAQPANLPTVQRGRDDDANDDAAKGTLYHRQQWYWNRRVQHSSEDIQDLL